MKSFVIFSHFFEIMSKRPKLKFTENRVKEFNDYVDYADDGAFIIL